MDGWMDRLDRQTDAGSSSYSDIVSEHEYWFVLMGTSSVLLCLRGSNLSLHLTGSELPSPLALVQCCFSLSYLSFLSFHYRSIYNFLKQWLGFAN